MILIASTSGVKRINIFSFKSLRMSNDIFESSLLNFSSFFSISCHLSAPLSLRTCQNYMEMGKRGTVSRDLFRTF